MNPWNHLTEHQQVVVCCGTGGVGKTTTSAAIAVAAAQAGRRAVVLTIDPAKRLADALGVDSVGNDPQVIDGPWSGTLAAVMLDAEATFDDAVRRHATDEAHAELILSNRFYRNVAGTLSGTQDYMAVEKLAELAEGSDWDLVVVDTPPTRDALTFIDAPRVLAQLLDNPIYQLLTGSRRGVLQVANRAANVVVSQLGRVVGASVVDDAIAFFQNFDGMEQGFKQRALATAELLAQPPTSFVLITSPRPDTVDEAQTFAKALAGNDLQPDVIVVNRAVPRTGVDQARAEHLHDQLAGTAGEPAAQALHDLTRSAASEDEILGRLAPMNPEAALLTVPMLATDIHDLDGLSDFGQLIQASPVR